MALILFVGYLKNAKVSVSALSICTNILGWALMTAFGFTVAMGVRVSNELGAAHPRAAKFSMVVSLISSVSFGLLFSIILIIWCKEYPAIFSNSEEVKDIVNSLTPILVVSITVNTIQPVLSGVAIGAGWQTLVAYINIGC